jgi:hypothetical protein
MRRIHELLASATRLHVAAGVAVALASGSLQTQAPPACASDSAFAWLDFWIGTWDVSADEQQAGENRIQKIVGGCAVTEEWTSAVGQRGHSLFYFRPSSRTWHQVWVTERALAPGGLKEKELIDRRPNGALLFQGEIPLAEGGTYLDRTTLTPIGPDEVRQLIEISTDGGSTWRTVFDGRYVRRR